VWFRKKLVELAPPPALSVSDIPVLAEAFAKSFASQIETNTKIATIFAEFTAKMGEMSIRQAARAMGQRSGESRARKREAARKKPSSCPLCENPLRRDVTVEMIRRHREHDTAESSPPYENGHDQSADRPPGIPQELEE
jgi:hypothetical protein